MTNDNSNPNVPLANVQNRALAARFNHSSIDHCNLIRHSSFVIRHSPLLFLLALALWPAPIARADDLLESTPTTKDPISINLPKSWKERPHDSSTTLLVAGPASPDTDTTGDYTPVLIIRATARPTTSGPIDGQAQQARVADEMTNYDITEKPSPISINGLDAVTFGGTFTQGALKLRSRQYFILANDHLYTLTLITLASTWEQHLPALEAALRTFTLSTKK